MATRKKQPAKSSPLKRVLRLILRYVCAAAVILLVWMFAEGSIVRLKKSTLPLDSLPSSFEGTRILYLSDLHINSLNSVDKVNALIDELARLNPDMLLLGGDYTSFDPLMRIAAGTSGKAGAYAIETELRDLFFLSLADFNPPLGKYGIAGENDNLLERNSGTALEDAMLLGGVQLLRDEAVTVNKAGESIVLVGVDDWNTGIQDTRSPASQVSSRDCVILLCHNPEAIPSLNNQPAADGIWIDAALSGHTHGGSINLFGLEVFNPLGSAERYQAGWHLENSAKVLISKGVGNDFLPLRLNASPEAHLITLTRFAE